MPFEFLSAEDERRSDKELRAKDPQAVYKATIRDVEAESDTPYTFFNSQQMTTKKTLDTDNQVKHSYLKRIEPAAEKMLEVQVLNKLIIEKLQILSQSEKLKLSLEYSEGLKTQAKEANSIVQGSIGVLMISTGYKQDTEYQICSRDQYLKNFGVIPESLGKADPIETTIEKYLDSLITLLDKRLEALNQIEQLTINPPEDAKRIFYIMMSLNVEEMDTLLEIISENQGNQEARNRLITEKLPKQAIESADRKIEEEQRRLQEEEQRRLQEEEQRRLQEEEQRRLQEAATVEQPLVITEQEKTKLYLDDSYSKMSGLKKLGFYIKNFGLFNGMKMMWKRGDVIERIDKGFAYYPHNRESFMDKFGEDKQGEDSKASSYQSIKGVIDVTSPDITLARDGLDEKYPLINMLASEVKGGKDITQVTLHEITEKAKEHVNHLNRHTSGNALSKNMYNLFGKSFKRTGSAKAFETEFAQELESYTMNHPPKQ